MGLGEIRLGEMGLGEMGQNRFSDIAVISHHGRKNHRSLCNFSFERSLM